MLINGDWAMKVVCMVWHLVMTCDCGTCDCVECIWMTAHHCVQCCSQGWWSNYWFTCRQLQRLFARWIKSPLVCCYWADYEIDETPGKTITDHFLHNKTISLLWSKIILKFINKKSFSDIMGLLDQSPNLGSTGRSSHMSPRATTELHEDSRHAQHEHFDTGVWKHHHETDLLDQEAKGLKS